MVLVSTSNRCTSNRPNGLAEGCAYKWKCYRSPIKELRQELQLIFVYSSWPSSQTLINSDLHYISDFAEEPSSTSRNVCLFTTNISISFEPKSSIFVLKLMPAILRRLCYWPKVDFFLPIATSGHSVVTSQPFAAVKGTVLDLNGANSIDWLEWVWLSVPHCCDSR